MSSLIMEGSSNDLKEIYRSAYTLAKNLDELKKNLTNPSQLFEKDIEKKRLELIEKCEFLLFNDHETIGKKSREILWRKGYYDFIAYIKKNVHKDLNGTKPKYLINVRDLLLQGFANYKRIASKMEQIYDLDLKLFIDFSLITVENDDDNDPNEEKMLISSNGADNQRNNHKLEVITVREKHHPVKSLEAVNFALETIHSAFLSLGDLHRYFLDFKFEQTPRLTKEYAARFYYEAFKMNPSIGMAQNQLGTLFYGQNYDLDSIYHYLYSLISTVPFELSENNVNKLFLAHAEYLEKLDPDKVEFNIKDFYARLFLIVDIFFFDKDVPDFNSLCHCVLIDLRKILCSKTIHIDEPSIFKIVCIFLFCMSKLKMINSQKVYSLNAFLVAVCSDLIDSCIVNLEQCILSKLKQNEDFQETYLNKFNKFEMDVRRSREIYKTYCEKQAAESGNGNSKGKQNGYVNKCSPLSDIEFKSQKSDHIGSTSNSSSNNNNNNRKNVSEGCKNAQRGHLTRSSDEAKESDIKTPASSKSAKKSAKLRRRRRRIQQSDESSCYDSESDIDPDFSSDDEGEEEEEEDVSDLSSNFESDFSDIEDGRSCKKDGRKFSLSDSEDEEKLHDILASNKFSDNEDIVVEEEKIIYPCSSGGEGCTSPVIENFHQLHINGVLSFRSDNDDEDRYNDNLPSQQEFKEEINAEAIINNNEEFEGNGEAPQKLKYKNKYLKIDPNIIIDFATEEITMRSLKILFDWLRINQEILIGCYHTNPEFIHKIMKLLNYCNIDVFTRKVYFEREFITTSNVRDDLEKLFNVRSTIPLSEDFTLRNFDLLQNTQSSLDWEATIRDKINPSEETIMRVFKMVDFAFFICKLKKFNYNFCPKTRRFSEDVKKKRDKKSSRKRDRKSRNSRRRNENCCGAGNGGSGNGRTRKYSDRKLELRSRKGTNNKNVSNNNVNSSNNNTSNEEKDTAVEEDPVIRTTLKKGYLKNRCKFNPEKTQQNGATEADDEKTDQCQNPTKPLPEKCGIMGKLWLKNEIETLEKELKNTPVNVVLTPFIVVDTKALTEFTSIVKSLVKTKKFIVLIPSAVIGDLDGLKKTSNNARAAIRWLEQEFKQGNRYLRAQRDNENLPLSLIKIPRKLDRVSSVFIQIAQFCNYIVTNHSDGSGLEINVMTFLSGDNLMNEKKHSNFSYTGILDAIPVRHDQISNYYSKFTSK